MHSTAGWRAVTERSARPGSVRTMYKLRFLKRTYIFITQYLSVLKHLRLESQPYLHRSPHGEPCKLGKLQLEYKTGTQD